MKVKMLTILGLILLVVGLVAGLWAATAYYIDLPNRISQHETIVLGQNRFYPGSKAALRVLVRDSKDAAPLGSAEIRVSLKPLSGGESQVLYTGKTDKRGGADVAFTVPEESEREQILVVETSSALGSDSIERPVTVERDYKVLLTTDKPIFQPGQQIHIRALALSTYDLVPASGQGMEIVISDGKGNKVFRETLEASEWGVAAVDFRLASEVNTGAYKISASLGNSTSEKTVTVEHYVLPKFDVTLETQKPFYLSGDIVHGTLDANYFFGKPVAGGEITLEGYTFDVERTVVVNLQGTTDGDGKFDFEFNLPAYIAGTELEAGTGRFYLQAAVTDLAKHTEISNLSLPISRDSLVIEAIPEGGQFKPGVENILYILTSYPDGSPAETSLIIDFYNTGENLIVETGEFGIADIPFVPQDPWQSLYIQALDDMGNAASREFNFEGHWDDETVLLRPEKPVYQVGETMDLTILTSAGSGSVYLDIIREGQTINTRAVDITDGVTQIAVDLTQDLYGTLELHAYKILRSGHITRDTRLVVVDNAGELDLTLTPVYTGGTELVGEEGSYRPGENARMDIQVRDQDGVGIQSVVGLAVVDESVFALAESDPGFAKLYFMLERELLQPKYDLHGFSVPDLVGGLPVENQAFVDGIENAAQASLSEASPQRIGFSLNVNSHDEAMQNASQQQTAYFGALSKGLFGLFLLVALLFIIIAIAAVLREKLFVRSILSAFSFLAIPVFLLWIWPHPWANNLSDKLGIFFDWLSWRGDLFLLVLLLLALVSLILLIFVAVRRKDSLLGWNLGFVPVILVILILLAFAQSESDISSVDKFLVIGLLAFLMVPFAFLIRSMGFMWSKRVLPALAALLLSVFLIGIIPIVTFGGGGMMLAAQNGGVFLEDPMMEMRALGVEMEVDGDFAMDMIAEAPPMDKSEGSISGQSSEVGVVEPPRLRQYFPETMLWLPEAVTDDDGNLLLDFLVADNITTWRVAALASTQNGLLGSATAPLRVFQDFFIDLDLPLALTVGDEVSIPVGVFNYLDDRQTVRLELEQAEWFEIVDKPLKEIEIEANDISVVYFRIRAAQYGRQPFKVTAWGSQMSDAIQKEVRVYPDGKQIHLTRSDRLVVDTLVQEVVDLPEDVIPGTQKLTVKIYPGMISQVVEGLENILRMPYGCFEQTSSTTYPNVLVLDYLKFTDQAAPEVQFKAEEYINLGYQRLTTFEVGASGGFSLFGDPPPDRMLTAYGLQEFSDMGRVHNVDPDLIQRAADWLFSQQDENGSWENDRGLVHENTWSSLGDDRLPVTAYIVWSLADAGFGDDPRTLAGLAYIKENNSEAADPYVLALIANALVAVDISTGADITETTLVVLDRLAGMVIHEGNGATWQSGVATFMGSEGQTGSIETTALIAYSFLRANRFPELTNAALTTLIKQKDSFGTWHSTQATVLALKALIQSVRAGAETVDATVTVSLNDGQTRVVEITSENFDVVQLLTFDDLNITGGNVVKISVEGEGNLMYQVSGSYYLPWEALPKYPQLAVGNQLVDIDLVYDRTDLAVNDTVGVNVLVSLKEGQAESALIDLGLPPGFSVETEDLAAMVVRFDDVPEDYLFPTIERFELTGRQILIYVSNLSAGNPLEFSYLLRAKYPLAAQTPASNAYDYYNPGVSGEAEPLLLVVTP